MEEDVLYEVRDATAVITVNRPGAGNSVNFAVAKGLAESLQRAAADAGVRAVVLTGAGDRVFISGGDIKEYNDKLQTKEDVYELMGRMRAVVARIQQFPKPVIAACNGAVRGGGGELACAAHFRIASRKATIGFVQIRLGISPGWGGGVLLQRLVGYQRTLRMLLTGEILSAEEAARIGIYDEIVEEDRVLDRAVEFAEQFASLSPHAVTGILQLTGAMDDNALALSMERESRLCAELWMTKEHEEAVQEFLRRSAKS